VKSSDSSPVENECNCDEPQELNYIKKKRILLDSIQKTQYIYIYINIYIEREREREREK